MQEGKDAQIDAFERKNTQQSIYTYTKSVYMWHEICTHAFSNKRSRYRCEPFFSDAVVSRYGDKGFSSKRNMLYIFLVDMKVGAPGQND